MNFIARILNHFSPITPTVQYKTPQSYPAQPGKKWRKKNAH